MKNTSIVSLVISLWLLGSLSKIYAHLVIFPLHIYTVVGSTTSVELQLSEPVEGEAVIVCDMDNQDIVRPIEPIEVSGFNISWMWNADVYAEEAGRVVVLCRLNGSLPTNTSISTAELQVTVGKAEAWAVMDEIVGWLYFILWSGSFYPQCYDNWKRKSVIGFSFDFNTLNILGYFCYTVFNCGLYWIPAVKDEYFRRHPNGINPVQINDIVFVIHALCIIILTGIQCCIYERGEQKISKITWGIIGVICSMLSVTLILVFCDLFTWLDWVYLNSYVKLFITFAKYTPQAYLNYKLQSTTGWSIMFCWLDLSGGVFSIMQMIFIAHNYNDWDSIAGDPTKFGLGLFTIVFDLLFMLQHYVLYRKAEGYMVANPSSTSLDVLVEDNVHLKKISHYGKVISIHGYDIHGLDAPRAFPFQPYVPDKRNITTVDAERSKHLEAQEEGPRRRVGSLVKRTEEVIHSGNDNGIFP